MIRANDMWDDYENDNLKRKEPESQFTGLWFPAELCNMVEDKEVTVSEAYLVSTINRFANARGEGCWASNARLGKMMGGLTERRIRQMIRILLDKGVIRKVKSDNYERVLITKWTKGVVWEKKSKRK